jgi:hypothetical protein
MTTNRRWHLLPLALRREAYDTVPQPEPPAAVVDDDGPLSDADVAELRAAAGRLVRR